MNTAHRPVEKTGEKRMPGISLISLEEDRILSSQDLDNEVIAAVLTIKAAFAGTIVDLS